MPEDKPIIEVRVMLIDDGRSWYDISPVEYAVNNSTEANTFCSIMSTSPGVKEVRWNWHGSTQGHYFERSA